MLSFLERILFRKLNPRENHRKIGSKMIVPLKDQLKYEMLTEKIKI